MSHYFDEHPDVGSDRATVTLTVGDRPLLLATDRGVFSRGEIDAGTAVLLRKAPPPPPHGTILDLGCGYGPIALALASAVPRCRGLGGRRERARARARHRERGGERAANVTVSGADAVPDDVTFDAIYSNPPIRIGKDALHDLLTAWLPRLTPEGAAYLVVQRHLGADSLHAWLEREGFPDRSRRVEQGFSRAEGQPAEGRVPVKQLRSVEQKRLHRSWQRRTEQRVALLLDGVQDPFNVGSIVRTAAALRVEHLYLSANATAPTHPKVGKTALGTQRYVEWTQYERVAEAAEAAHADGFAIVGLELADESVPFFELDLAGDVCIALGNESNGLNATALALCDAVGYIPQLGRVGSLNVAAATAVALYETRRQGWQEG